MMESETLGSIGHFGCFSFHETKNIQCGEGGMLVINDERFFKRAEIIWEKGTNRAEFSRGEVNKYGWIDIGSSFLPSEITAAFLWAQVEALATIQLNRKCIWQNYYQSLSSLLEEGYYKLPKIPEYATNNAHLFYLICKSIEERSNLIEHLKRNGIMAIFHYLSLHNSPYFLNKHDGRPLPNSERFSECLLRLPLYYELGNDLIDYIVTNIKLHYQYSD